MNMEEWTIVCSSKYESYCSNGPSLSSSKSLYFTCADKKSII
jgi:hypothetical protein